MTEREDAILDKLAAELARRRDLEGHVTDLWAASWELLLALPFDQIGSQARAAAEKLGKLLPPPEEP